MKTMKTCKYGCGKMATGGVAKVKKVKKMAKGGTMYGIPQENLGTSGQYGFAKTGGSVKKAKLAALAAPKNKITRADVIAGALKNKRKK
jgi:hypothetical protein